MTTKTYKWGHGGLHHYEWHDVADACKKLTGEAAINEADAVDKLTAHFGSTPRIGYDEGPEYFEGGHNDD